MKIEAIGFNQGAQFRITAHTEAERTLLIACTDSDVLVHDNDAGEAAFVLTLPVSNE